MPVRAFVRPALILLCALVPPIVTGRDWWFIGRTFDARSEPFEVMGLLVSAAVLLYWAEALRCRSGDRNERIAAHLVVGVVVLQAVYGFVNHPGASGDYQCYNAAAQRIVAGADPWDGTYYLYPPLLAQALAGVQRGIVSSGWFATGKTSSWWIVFYLYQALQLLLLLSVVERCFAYGRRLRIPIGQLAVFVALLFAADDPLFRTLRFQQVNLIVLLAILHALVHGEERPWSCGLLMAVSVFVKPQAALLPLVWLLIGQRRAVAGFVAASAVLVLVQADLGRDWTPWRQFLGSLDAFPVTNDYFRNQSLFSFSRNLATALHLELPDATLLWIVRVAEAGILALFVRRAVERERRFRRGGAPVAEGPDARDLRAGAHTADAILLALLLSPLVWEHHYVLVIPIALWLFGAVRGRVPRLAIVGLVLILVPSTFDVWPLSYHRLAGSLLLLVALSPERLERLLRDARGRDFIGGEGWATPRPGPARLPDAR